MTNATETTVPTIPAVEGEGYYLLTSCADHGTRECPWESARHYFELVESWWGVFSDPEPEVSPWHCCDKMVLDPWGVFDH